jgi:signal transduction histidine kinase
VKEKAVLEERQRLARELHDSVSQALYGIALGARTARELLDRDPTQAAEPLDYVLSLAAAALAEMRALIFELRPETLESEGLVGALARQVESARARHGLEIYAEWCDEPDLPVAVKEAIYRIAQEALTNITKHARARRVEVRMVCGPDEVALDVRDDGVGFASEDSFPGHLGLHSMRERARNAGGTVVVESAPLQGTRIRIRIPHTQSAA